ncbi:MAG: GNAT family N-acetyltransferase [Alphaproteobacteria bacterium]|nr:GNAT family N-acetyltransferase [Alphaproteobacteria bacterium]
MTKIIKHEINGNSIWFGKLPKVSGEIQGEHFFVIRPLSHRDVHKMQHLSCEIYDYLHEDEKCYIHRHDSKYFSSVFNQKDIAYIGVFHASKLIGMSYFRICRDKDAFIAEIPTTSMPKITQGRPVAALGGDCVHPNYRGNGLNRLMISYRMHMTKKQGCYETYSIIDRHNHWNMRPYFDNDFCMFDSGIDPSDNGQIAVMRYVTGQQLEIGKCNVSTLFHQFDQIDCFLKKGYVAFGYDTRTQHLTFSRILSNRTRICRNLSFSKNNNRNIKVYS